MLVVRRSKSIVFAVMIGGVLTTSAARPADSYHVVHGWPQLPPGEALGRATGVDVDSRGNVLVFHRAGRRWSEPMPTTTIGRATIWVFEKQSVPASAILGRQSVRDAAWASNRSIWD
jgi:hypothetical protein